MATATFGGGCFWGVEEVFRTMDGVKTTTVGYMGGTTQRPTYQDVCTGETDHAEVVQVEFDPETVSFDALLDVFFSNHNPTQLNFQGPDVGTQYRSVVFFHDEAQKAAAEAAKAALVASGRFRNPVVTRIDPASTFWEAEDYHQQYLAKRGMTSCHI